MFSEQNSFKTENRERKIELVKIDAYNLMIRFLLGKIELDQLRPQLDKLAALGLISKENLKQFINDQITYEAYHLAKGKEKNSSNHIRRRAQEYLS